MRSVINELNINKPTTYNNIPAKILVDNVDICSHYITETYNHAVLNCTFPDALKTADITPVYKKDEKILKSNYRPVSILSCFSKIFERSMYHDIWGFIKPYLSNYLCRFRKGYSTESCLIAIIEKCKKA